jgi:hypothetical protein
MRTSWISLALVIAVCSCGGGSDKTDPGKTCQYNSDCQSGLTCSFGRCMSACQAETDCPTGQQCVKNSSGINVCLLPEVETCNYTTQCTVPLICASDFKCRNQCLSDRDCATKTQKCVLPDGVCAEPSAIDPTTNGLKGSNTKLDGGAIDGSYADVSLRDASVIDAVVADKNVPDSPLADIAVADVPLGAEVGAEVGDLKAGVSEAGTCTFDVSAMTIASTITADLTLPYRAGCKYKVTSSVTVRTGATVTIEPGVEIEFGSGLGFNVEGILNAAGTAELPIRFYGAQTTPGYWKGVVFYNTDSVSNLLDHVIIENAGTYTTSSTSSQPASLVVNAARLQVRNTTIRGGSGYGVTLYSSTLDDFSANTITTNAKGAVWLGANRIKQLNGVPLSTFAGNTVDVVTVTGETVSVAQTWPALDVPYFMDGHSTLNADVAIPMGTKLLFAKDAYITVATSGSLNVKGTATKPVRFSGDQATKGYWKGLVYDSSDNINNLLEYVIIENAGTATTSSTSSEPASLVVDEARIQVKSCTIQAGNGYGVTLYSPILDDFSGNTITGNTTGAAYLHVNIIGKLNHTPENSYNGNNVDYVVVNGGTVSTDQTWPVLNVPYLVTSDITVSAQVTIAPGATFIFKQDTGLTVSSTGGLTAKGLPDAGKQIVLTGQQQTAGYWDGIYVNGTKNVNNIFDYVTVSYGGGIDHSVSNSASNIYVYSAQLTVTNSTITNSANYGISWNSSATVTQTNNTFSGNVIDHP